MKPEYWIGIGTFLFVLGTAMVTWGTIRSNNEIATKAGQITNLAAESLNQLTSADSFCYLQASVGPEPNRLSLWLFHQGKYAISDVQIVVHDAAATQRFWDTFKQSGRTQLTSAEQLQSTGVIFHQSIGTVIPNTGRILLSIPYNYERKVFNISILACNGIYLETITFVKNKKEDGFLFDEHLVKLSDGKEHQIWERVSPDFHDQ
jgi:hypothetical protein